MVRRGSRRCWPSGGILLAALAALSPLRPAPSHAQQASESALYLARSSELAAAGRHAEALVILRAARERYATSELLPELLLQSARVAREAGEEFLARYFLGEILRREPQSAQALEAATELGDALFADSLYRDAYEAYRAGEPAALRGASALAERLLLRLSELAAFYLGDREAAWEHAKLIDASRLDRADRETYAMVLARARWTALSPGALGLADPNVSALATDADDLWVGTWSGGLARYSISERRAAVFRAGENSLVANTIRSVCVTARHVWVGTDQGLSQYSKALSLWRHVEVPAGGKSWKVQSIREIEGRIYVATLGDGLWLFDGDAREEVAPGRWPTKYLTCLAPADDGILVGTMDSGLLLLDRERAVRRAPETGEGARPRNITAVCVDERGVVWVATYGEGLWEWNPPERTLRHYAAGDGRIGDDWVMCIAESLRGLYFGTFGGGVSFVDRSGAWQRFGLAEGLAGMDVVAAVASGSGVYFGTLGNGVSILREDPGR